MKYSKLFILILILFIFSATGCTDKNAKLDETEKFLTEDYSELILPEDKINDIVLSNYQNHFELTEEEQAAIDKFKGKTIQVAVPIEAGFLDEVNGEYLGINFYSVLQLEKDLGLNFEYTFIEAEELANSNEKFDISSAYLHSELAELYDMPKTDTGNILSKPYYSTSYAAFSKQLLLTDMDIKAALIANSGIWLPYTESLIIKNSSATSSRYPNIIESNSLDEFMSLDLPYLILPDNSIAPKYGYHKMFFRNYSYEITSSFVLSDNTFDEAFISAVNKTITTDKEKNIGEYAERLELLKCYEGFFFTDKEKEYIARHKNDTIKTIYMSSEYPLSYYDSDNDVYIGKLVALLSRASVVTGLDFEDVSSSTDLSVSDALSSLYNRDVDLAVGIEDAFNRNVYIKFSNRLTTDSYTYVGYSDSIKELNDVYNYRIGAINNSAMEQHLNSFFPTKEIEKYADADEAYLALKNNDIDYIVVPKETYYYLINNYNDFKLKNIFATTLPADKKFGAPTTEDGELLISILNKVVDRVDKYEIMNANYPLAEVDTVGSYRTVLFLRIFVGILIILVSVGAYYFYQLKIFKTKNRNIKRLNNKLNSAFKIANFGVLTTNQDSDYFVLDDIMIDLIGIDPDDIFVKKSNKCITHNNFIYKYAEYGGDENVVLNFFQSINTIKDSHKGEFEMQLIIKRNQNPEDLLYFDTIITMEDDETNDILIVLRDATKEALYEKYETAVSTMDPTTETKNRIAAFKIDFSQFAGRTCAYINIDNFNQINNTYGHNKGDATLKSIVLSLYRFSHTADLYRMNGDEFFVVLDSFDEDIAKELIGLLRQTIKFSHYEIKITASIGFFTIDGSMTITNDEIVNICNYGMLQAKQEGKDRYVIVDEKMLEDYRQINKLDALLKVAIQEGDIIPFFQPYINVETGKVVGYETLMRWKTDDGILSPFFFLSIAIKNGYIYDIDMIMFRESARFLKQLQDEGLAGSDFVASSNFTPVTLIQVDPIELVKIVNEIGISPKNMTIEVTEQLFASDKAFEHIAILKDFGFNIALDDFSVGHSSMAYLKRLKVDVLKLDKSLLDDTNNKTSLDIFKTVVYLGKSLNAKIISEGVETAEEVEVLKATKVSIGQGYFFAKPSNEETIHEYIKEKNS